MPPVPPGSDATVADVMAALEEVYPPDLAESWDRVGLAVGSRAASVARVGLCVDVTAEVVAEAAERRADLLIAHHPPFLHGLHAVDLDTPKGALIADLLRSGIAVYVAHTNADLPPRGTADLLARALGLVDARPLAPVTPGSDTGLGRVGRLGTPTTLGLFADRVAAALPATPRGLLLAGSRDRPIETVAVQAGAGDDLFDEARAAGADVYVTSDLRHHPASDALAWPGAPALIDIPHWAAEWLWLPEAERIITAALAVETYVSTLCTDPWTARLP